MTQIMDTFTKMSGNNYSPGTITGKPIPVGGSLARNVATGLGNAYCIREAAKILNIDTDAKYRFDRGIDPNSIQIGLELGMCMILDLCGGEASKFSIVNKLKDERKIIDLEPEKFSKVIGFSVTSAEIKKILSSLGCSLRMSGKKMKV